jgi:hypothetical protein
MVAIAGNAVLAAGGCFSPFFPVPSVTCSKHVAPTASWIRNSGSVTQAKEPVAHDVMDQMKSGDSVVVTRRLDGAR